MKHCFHDTGEMLTSNPPAYWQACCHCDAKRTRMPRQVAAQGHGRFVKQATFESKTENDYQGGPSEDEACPAQPLDCEDLARFVHEAGLVADVFFTDWERLSETERESRRKMADFMLERLEIRGRVKK